MAAKMGRPKTENPNAIRIAFRLDAKTDKDLTEYCEKNHVSKGEAIRRGLKMLLAEK